MDIPAVVTFLTSHVAAMGPIVGPAAYIVFLALWIVCCMPCTPIEILPGFLFGSWKIGALVSALGKTLGSLLSMIIGRYFLHDRVERVILKRFPLVRKLGIAIEKEGFSALVMIRAMPISMAFKNYGLAILPGVTIRSALLAGSFTAIPHSIIWALVGTKVKNVTDISASHNLSMKDVVLDLLPGPVFWALGALMVGMSVYVSRGIARRFYKMLDTVEEDQPVGKRAKSPKGEKNGHVASELGSGTSSTAMMKRQQQKKRKRKNQG